MPRRSRRTSKSRQSKKRRSRTRARYGAQAQKAAEWENGGRLPEIEDARRILNDAKTRNRPLTLEEEVIVGHILGPDALPPVEDHSSVEEGADSMLLSADFRHLVSALNKEASPLIKEMRNELEKVRTSLASGQNDAAATVISSLIANVTALGEKHDNVFLRLMEKLEEMTITLGSIRACKLNDIPSSLNTPPGRPPSEVPVTHVIADKRNRPRDEIKGRPAGIEFLSM